MWIWLFFLILTNTIHSVIFSCRFPWLKVSYHESLHTDMEKALIYHKSELLITDLTIRIAIS